MVLVENSKVEKLAGPAQDCRARATGSGGTVQTQAIGYGGKLWIAIEGVQLEEC